jgi:hypothetical protein
MSCIRKHDKQGKETSMNDSELDAVYTRLCKTMTELGADKAPLFLARFALLAIEQIDDSDVAARIVDDAAAGMAG